MTADRVSFTKPSASCAACSCALESGASRSFDPGLGQPAAVVELCVACAARIANDGPSPPPLVPEFTAMPALRAPRITRRDLRSTLDELVRASGPLDEPTQRLLARLEQPRLADHEAWLARVAAAGRKPAPLDLAAALLSAALLDLEPQDLDGLVRLADRASSCDEFELAVGAALGALGLSTAQRSDAPPGRAEQLLELAERRFLLASVPATHPLAARALGMRLSIALARGRHDFVDATLSRGQSADPRLALLRGVRAAQCGKLWAADREFLAAIGSPQAAEDPELRSTALWNRASRACAATRWPECRDALAAYVRLQPADAAARLALGHAYVRCAMLAVAREALGSVLEGAFAGDALEHVASLASDRALSPALHAEGLALHATALLALGEASHAVDVLASWLDSNPEPGPRRVELLRLSGRAHLATDRPDPALAALAEAWSSTKTQALAHELAFAAVAAAREALAGAGLSGLRAALERRRLPFDALRTHCGALGAFLFLSFLSAQIRTGFRPAPSFGLDWNWLKLEGADARSATLQAYSALARHQIPAALRHDLAAQSAGGAAVPFALLAQLFAAAREAPQDEVDGLLGACGEAIAVLLRELGGR